MVSSESSKKTDNWSNRINDGLCRSVAAYIWREG